MTVSFDLAADAAFAERLDGQFPALDLAYNEGVLRARDVYAAAYREASDAAAAKCAERGSAYLGVPSGAAVKAAMPTQMDAAGWVDAARRADPGRWTGSASSAAQRAAARQGLAAFCARAAAIADAARRLAEINRYNAKPKTGQAAGRRAGEGYLRAPRRVSDLAGRDPLDVSGMLRTRKWRDKQARNLQRRPATVFYDQVRYIEDGGCGWFALPMLGRVRSEHLMPPGAEPASAARLVDRTRRVTSKTLPRHRRYRLDLSVRVYAAGPCPAKPSSPSQLRPEHRMAGVDVGAAVTIADSDGNTINAPGWAGEYEKIGNLQKEQAERKQGSRSFRRLERQIAKLHGYIARSRRGWVTRTSVRYARGHDLVVLEDIRARNLLASPKGTVDNPGKNVRACAARNKRMIRKATWQTRVAIIDECRKSGTMSVTVPAAGTSITCWRCGHSEKANRESQASFACVSCGRTDNADRNASTVILHRGLTQIGRQDLVDGGRGKTQSRRSGKRKPPSQAATGAGHRHGAPAAPPKQAQAAHTTPGQRTTARAPAAA